MINIVAKELRHHSNQIKNAKLNYFLESLCPISKVNEKNAY